MSSTIGKVFEYALLDKGLNGNQSELQVGFSEGLSPGLVSLLLSEAYLMKLIIDVHHYILLRWTTRKHSISRIIN